MAFKKSYTFSKPRYSSGFFAYQNYMKPCIKPTNLVLRCYAEEEKDGTWFAICLDLNVYARGDNFSEVRSKLNQLIRSYVREAVEKDAEYVSDLLPRRAPVYFWLRYALIVAMGHIHRLASRQEFKVPVPLVPAF